MCHLGPLYSQRKGRGLPKEENQNDRRHFALLGVYKVTCPAH